MPVVAIEMKMDTHHHLHHHLYLLLHLHCVGLNGGITSLTQNLILFECCIQKEGLQLNPGLTEMDLMSHSEIRLEIHLEVHLAVAAFLEMIRRR